MKKTVFTISIFVAALVSNAQQLTNGGFETWSGSVPNSWGTMDAALAAASSFCAGGTTVTQSSVPHSGSFAVTLATKATTCATVPGIIEYGSMAVNISTSSAIFKGLPYTSSPTSATYWIFGTVAANDTALTQILLTKWNTVSNSRDTIGRGYDQILSTSGLSASTYTMRTVTITYTTTPPAPDTIQYLVISSIKKTATVGNTITVDDINLLFTTGIESLHATQAANIAYPNPAVSQITISSTNEKAKYAKVYDLTGRLITTHELTNKTATLDVNAFENGMYLYSITDENNHTLSTSKFSVSK
ncbi:MAG: T9SS type A sorting domain-containing protein [Bacteroidia bacterium]